MGFRVIIDRINSAINRTVGSCRCHLSSIDSVFIILLANAVDTNDRISSVDTNDRRSNAIDTNDRRSSVTLMIGEVVVLCCTLLVLGLGFRV